MKKLIILISVFTVLLFPIGCSQKVEDTIEEPPTLEEPVENKTDEEDIKEEIIIVPKDKVDVTELTLLDDFNFDFDNDGNKEKIGMYTEAQRDSDGEIAWDDGQNWLFVVQDSEKDYVLLDEYVQLGNVYFYVYMVDDDFYIATISARTASLVLTSYRYDIKNDNFITTVPYEAIGNVNMLKSSNFE